MKTQKLLHLISSTSIAVMIGAGINFSAYGMDTDIYLKAQSISRDDQPNVLIILDNSGSMSTVITSRQAYDPTINYCTDDLDTKTGITGANSGKPSNCSSITNRIFFSFTGSPPSTSSSRYFSTSKNYCLNSTSALSSTGFYAGSKIAKWQSGSNWGSLSGLSDSSITYVDCELDGSSNGQATGDGNFPRSSSSTAYTSQSNKAFLWTNFTSNTSPTLYSANYMNYANNTSLSTSRTRMDIAKDSVKNLIDSNTSVRFGLMVFNEDSDSDTNNAGNHGGRLLYKIDTMTDARRTAMKAVIDTIQPSTWTPLAETMWEAYSYLSGSAVDYGNNNPIYSVSSITRSGSTVTVTTSSSHNYNTGDYVLISGATQTEYNGAFVVTVTSSTKFTYTITGTPTTPGTGTITATMYRDTSAESGSNYVSPFAYSCQKAYIILVTDGDPTNDSNADSKIKAKIGATSCDSPSCMDDLVKWMHDNDIYTGLSGDQKVATYTIGFGGSISASGLALLQQTATKGGGQYYTADDADALASSLQGAMAQIIERNTSFTSPSLSVNAFNRLYNRDEVYFALFKPSNNCNWSGNVKKYKLCTNADISAGICNSLSDILDVVPQKIIDSSSKIIDQAQSYWSTSPDGSTVTAGGAGAHIPAPASRNVYTYTGSYTGLSSTSEGTVVPVTVDSTNAFYQAVTADPTLLGLPSTASTTDINNLVNWMRGQDSYDKNADGSTTDQRWSFSDPLHSRPVAVTFGGTSSDPIIKLFVGTNGGQVRMINNSTGVEEWAFIPKEMWAQQYPLSQEADSAHYYGLDGTPTFYVIDTNADGIIDPSIGDKVYMYISQRRGGRNIYAFDLTPSAKMTTQSDTVTPKLMWVIQGGSGDFASLGQTWSRPTLTRLRFKCTGTVCDDGDPTTNDSESRQVLVFAGGYDTNQDNAIPAGTDSMGNAIYVVDPKTGGRIFWISKSGADYNISAMKYSIPSDVALEDSDGDGNADRLYVGDTGGQIFRIDFGNQLAQGSAGGTTGYVFADVGCTGGSRSDDCSATTAQNRLKFFYQPDIAQVKDTVYSSSPNYDLIAIGTGDREDPLDLLPSNLSSPSSKEAVHNRIYALRDYNYQTGAPATTPSALTESNLYDLTSNPFATDTGSQLATDVTTLKAKNGWFVNLKSPTAITVPNGLTTQWIGEKVLARVTIFEGVIHATTFTPANDTNATTTCSANEGVATQWALDAFVATGELGTSGTDRSEQVGGGIPSEVVIIFRPDGTSGLIGTSGGAASAGGITNTGPQRTWWYEE